MIILDTSVLVDALTGPRRSEVALRAALARGERILVPALVHFEWLRGPRIDPELEAQEALFPASAALHFGPKEADAAAKIYGAVSRPRGRDFDLAIAAHAVVLDADLWTLNTADFSDLPGLGLVS